MIRPYELFTRFISNKKCLISLVSLFILGLMIGGTHNLSWNDIVENSAFKAGLITYDIKTPQYLFQNRLQGIFYYIFENLFRLGFNELDLARCFSAFFGGISFIILGSLSFMIFRSYFAISIVLIIEYFWLYKFGVNYNIAIINSQNPQGSLGLITCLFCLVNYSYRRNNRSTFLIALSPLFHLTLGIWINFSLVIVEAIQTKFKIPRKRIILYFLGAAITLAFYIFTAKENLLGSFVNQNFDFLNYIKWWDLHQQPYHIANAGIWLSLLVIILLFQSKNIQEKTLGYSFLIFFIVATFHGFLGHPLNAYLPQVWWSLMPSRLLNFSILYCAVYFLTYGLKEKNITGLLIVLMFGIVFIYGLFFGRSEILFHNQIEKFKIIIMFVYLASSLLLYFKRNILILEKPLTKLLFVPPVIIGLVTFFIIKDYALSMKKAYAFNKSQMIYYRNNNLLKKLKSEGSLVLTAPSIKQFQLVSGLPIIFELDTIDDLLYNPKYIKKSAIYIHDLYGINFNNPQKNFRNDIPLMDSWVRNLWEQRTKEIWTKLSDQYKFSHVVVPSFWKLNMKLMDQNDRWRVYQLN